MSDAGDLPEGWAEAQLSTITSKIGSGATPRGGSNAYQPSGIPLIRSQNVHFDGFNTDGLAFLDDAQAAALDGVKVHSNDVLLNITGASIGRVCLAPGIMGGARVNQHVAIIRLSGALEPSLLSLYLRSPAIQNRINTEEYGVTRQALTKGWISDLLVPLPPQPEQDRIVEKVEALLDHASKVEERLDRVHAILKRFRQAVLAAACSGRLTDDWRARASCAPAIEIEGLPGWRRRTVGDLVEVATGATPLRKNPAYYKGGKVPWVKSGAVNRDPIMEADEFITEKAIRETNAKVFPAGTLVMAMYGEGATRGKVAELGIPCATNQALAALIFSDTASDLRHFLKLALQSQYDAMREDAAGGVQPNLSLGAIRDIEVDVPPPGEQAEIVRIVQRMFTLADAIEARVTAAAARANKLPQAILSKAFRGELVPTEAELARAEGRPFESAEEMLKRVTKEQPVTRAKKTRRRAPA